MKEQEKRSMSNPENMSVPSNIAANADEPDAPQNLIAVADGPIRINTSWDGAAGAELYKVYRSTTVSGPYELVGLTAATSYTDAGLIPNTTYYYRVSATAGTTEGALSNIASATTDADVPMPTNVIATPVSQTQINTTWNPVPNAMAYAVYRSTTPDGTYQYVGTASGPAYSDTGLTPGTTYYYRVAAIVGGAEGTPSAYAAATTYPEIPVPPCRPCCCPRCGCSPCRCPREQHHNPCSR